MNCLWKTQRSALFSGCKLKQKVRNYAKNREKKVMTGDVYRCSVENIDAADDLHSKKSGMRACFESRALIRAKQEEVLYPVSNQRR